ncbi:hypothetical protein OCU04_000672 [Sclerotinia nivalis]|uniref:Uncharacterized protein n=1 Tax=Sclerotinia nivalis TaxID=352851 RepID=A0A9X0DQ09_9HELO|nr:hypothetical protein OCU04_000672 [Sclerotinia nivalis]
MDAGVDIYAKADGFKWTTGIYALPGSAKFTIYKGGTYPDLTQGSPSRRSLQGPGDLNSSLDMDIEEPYHQQIERGANAQMGGERNSRQRLVQMDIQRSRREVEQLHEAAGHDC